MPPKARSGDIQRTLPVTSDFTKKKWRPSDRSYVSRFSDHRTNSLSTPGMAWTTLKPRGEYNISLSSIFHTFISNTVMEDFGRSIDKNDFVLLWKKNKFVTCRLRYLWPAISDYVFLIGRQINLIEGWLNKHNFKKDIEFAWTHFCV